MLWHKRRSGMRDPSEYFPRLADEPGPTDKCGSGWNGDVTCHATFGFVAVNWACSRWRSEVVPFAFGVYMTPAYRFTSSTRLANRAVTLARAASDTFAGIRPVDAPGFIAAPLVGANVAPLLNSWLVRLLRKTSLVNALISHATHLFAAAGRRARGRKDRCY